MKKSTSLFIISLILVLFLNKLTYANNNLEISSYSAILMDMDTKEILYKKNINERLAPASITKIMTALVVLENTKLSSKLKFSKRAINNLESGAVSIGALANDEMRVEDAMYALMLKSANDVANALAEKTSGSIEDFIKLMNLKVKNLGLKNTNFTNPHGLNNKKQYTSSYDMALITIEAFKNKHFRKIVATPMYIIKNLGAKKDFSIKMGHKMLHKNHVRYYEGFLGGKTGYTSVAGNTLVSVAKRGKKRLVVVILKSQNTHYEDTKKLFDYGFSNSPKITLKNDDLNINKIEDKNKEEKSINKQLEEENIVESIPEEILIKESLPSPLDIKMTGKKEAEVNKNELNKEVNIWIKEENKYKYLKSDGKFARDEILDIDGSTYIFDENAHMCTSWYKDKKGNWYYLRTSGQMKKSAWVSYEKDWYYLGEDGIMLKDTKSPDGYILDKKGRWISAKKEDSTTD